jgi:hypothetical protein
MEVFGLAVLWDFPDFYIKRILELERAEVPKWHQEEIPLAMVQPIFITNLSQGEEELGHLAYQIVVQKIA